jgi:AcrR family transcriptional regulator
MSRKTPEIRFRELIEAATEVFIAQGYRHTQMADVAAAMGVAKGTLYVYVESKEALLDLTLRSVSGGLDLDQLGPPPYPTPAPGVTARMVGEYLSAQSVLPSLTAALQRREVTDLRRELEEILRDLYALLATHRTAIKLVDRCSASHPELAKVWFDQGRYGEHAILERYLRSEARREHLRAPLDPAVAARLILETLSFWAVHRFWDPAPQPVDDKAAENTVVEMLLGGLIEE